MIIPVLNEAAHITATLAALQPLRTAGHEILVVDGGSGDATAALARPLCDRVLQAARGRARQMNAGARAACGDVLWFLHADTLATPPALAALLNVLAQPACAWGHFDVRLTGAQGTADGGRGPREASSVTKTPGSPRSRRGSPRRRAVSVTRSRVGHGSVPDP